MKKKIFYIIFMIAGLLQACAPEIDDLFDKPAQERMNETLKACRNVLIGSELGWRLDYYPSATQAYGGYNMVLKFTEKEVTAAGETADPTYTETSLYSMGADMGPTLNFDSYNSIIHYFADPDKAEGGGTGKGYEGDYEFVIMSYDTDRIVLKGKKTKNIMVMTRMEEPADVYLSKVKAVSDDFYSLLGAEGAEGALNGVEVAMTFVSDRRLNVQVGYEELHKRGYMFTPTGIRFYEPLAIGGGEVRELEWLAEEQCFGYEDSKILLRFDPNKEDYMQYVGTYTMEYVDYYGEQASVQVEVSPREYKKSYTLKGMLPFDVILIYNEPVVDGVKTPRMELLNQKLLDGSGNFLSPWEVDPGNLVYGGTDFQNGLYAQRDAANPSFFRFVDVGRWEGHVCRGMILWGQNGEYKPCNSRFSYITLTKHE